MEDPSKLRTSLDKAFDKDKINLGCCGGNTCDRPYKHDQRIKSFIRQREKDLLKEMLKDEELMELLRNPIHSSVRFRLEELSDE